MSKQNTEKACFMDRLVQSCAKPEGTFGRLNAYFMNLGHMPLHRFALSKVLMKEGLRILDVGCGGGSNIRYLLKKYPSSHVDGIDYSEESVRVSKSLNKKNLGTRCEIRQGDVSDLPYEDKCYDFVTAFETVYFWPDLRQGFEEICRVLKGGGRFLIALEDIDPKAGEKYTSHCDAMVVHTLEELCRTLKRAGFSRVKYAQGKYGTAILAVKE